MHNTAYEENIANQYITEGKRCIAEGKIDDAITLLLEVNNMHKLRENYGATIISNLAYAYTLKKNFTLAKQFIEDYHMILGS